MDSNRDVKNIKVITSRDPKVIHSKDPKINANKDTTVKLYSTQILGGTVAEIYLGLRTSNEELVAVKKFFSTETDPQIVNKEFEIMQSLTILNAPNIVKYHGHYTDNEDNFYVVMDYAINGDLSNWLEKKDDPLTRIEQLKIMAGIANGIDYMHDTNIIHGDISPSHVLLNAGLTPMLCDFRQSIRSNIDDPQFISGSRDYLAPELLLVFSDALLTATHTKQTDIYSFATLCWQIIEDRSEVYPDIDETSEFIQRIVTNKERHKINTDIFTPNIAKFITLGWAHDSNKRPSAKVAAITMNQALVNAEQIEIAIDILAEHYDFFSAPFINFETFQSWAKTNELLIKPFSEALWECLSLPNQIRDFKQALFSLEKHDSSEQIEEFLLSNKKLVDFLLHNEGSAIMKKWTEDNDVSATMSI